MKFNIKTLSIAGMMILLLSGCTTTKTLPTKNPSLTRKEVMHNYLSNITKYDGIDRQEAITLAQSHLIFHGQENDYYFDIPQILFEDEEGWGIRFYPITQKGTGTTLTPSVLITVNKKDGRIRFEKEFLN